MFRNTSYCNSSYNSLHIYNVEVVSKQNVDCRNFVHNNSNVIDSCNNMLGGCFEHNKYVESQDGGNNVITNIEEQNNFIDFSTLFL